MQEYVDIIIVNYNTCKFLQDCVRSIAENTDYPYRLLVIDNNSADGSKRYLESLQRRGVQVVFNRENTGCARAWNQGIKLSSGKYLLFLNPDTLLSPGWLSKMVACAESDEAIAVVGNKQVTPEGIILHAGLVEENGRAYFRGEGEKDAAGKFSEVCDCLDVCGACYLVKRTCIERIGLFDERFFLYAEETDFSHRARLAGLRVVYCPVTIIHHKDGAPISQEDRWKIHRQSCELFDAKWREGGEDQ